MATYTCTCPTTAKPSAAPPVTVVVPELPVVVDRFASTLAAIVSGAKLRRDLPHVAAALRAAPDNAVLSGAYACWQFAPRNAEMPLPFSPRILVYGVDAAARLDAFRSIVDAAVAATRALAPHDLVCFIATKTATVATPPSWTLMSAAWSHPLSVVLTSHATADEVRGEWGGGVDVLSAFVRANCADDDQFSVLADGAARAALSVGSVCVPSVQAALDKRCWATLAVLGYRIDATSAAGAAALAAASAAENGDTIDVALLPTVGDALRAFPASDRNNRSASFRYAPLIRCRQICCAGDVIGSGESLLWGVESDAAESRYRLVTLGDNGVVCKRSWLPTARYASVFDASCFAYYQGIYPPPACARAMAPC